MVKFFELNTTVFLGKTFISDTIILRSKKRTNENL